MQHFTQKAKMALISAKQAGAQGINKAALFGAAMFCAAAAHADEAIDITAATAGISAAKVASLSVLAAMLAMAAAVWGVYRVLKMFNRGG